MHVPEGHSAPKIRPLGGAGILRALDRVLPLGRHLHPVLSLLNGSEGLTAVPFAGRQLVHPLAWRKSVAALLLRGEHCVPEARLLPPLLAPLRSGTLLDVGANIGIYTLLMRNASALPIMAYEPQPLLFRLLELCVAHNRLPNVECRALACGDSKGEVPFSIGFNGEVATGEEAREVTTLDAFDLEQAIRETGAAQAVVNVPVTTLDDDLGETPVAFLKIDCEGFEHRILRGAARLLERQRPLLFIEVHPFGLEKFGSSARAVVDLLSPLYSLEGWDFSEIRFASKLVRSLRKHRPTEGRKFASMDEFLAAARNEPRPAQLYLVGRPL
ncbi:MAG: FkbM family methyltransferase [Verrucomicrobia bacterium]|nr:MAG: FkbM family methyltransferase [Verrucomicrobiota bacterium]